MSCRFPKQKKTKPITLAAAVLAILTFGPAHAAVLTSGNFTTGTPTPTLTISEDINLTITGNGSVEFLIFDDWVASDGTATGAVSVPTDQTLSYSINGGATSTVTAGRLTDNAAGIFGSFTPNDGYLRFGSIAVTTGQTLTIKAQSWTYASNPTFNPAIPSLFTGSVFVTNGFGAALSAPTAVPEPSVALLAAVALSAFLLLRRRRSVS